MEHDQSDIKSVLIDEREIQGIVQRLGAEITRDYAGESLVVVCVLKGAFVFASDLVRQISLPCTVDFMSVSSYGNSTKSSGEVNVMLDLTVDITDKHVLVVEDIFDTGLTLFHVLNMLKHRGAASVDVATFALKDLPGTERPFMPRYVGTHVPNEFIVGYGLDYAGWYRNLPYIGVLKPEIYA